MNGKECPIKFFEFLDTYRKLQLKITRKEWAERLTIMFNEPWEKEDVDKAIMAHSVPSLEKASKLSWALGLEVLPAPGDCAPRKEQLQ